MTVVVILFPVLFYLHETKAELENKLSLKIFYRVLPKWLSKAVVFFFSKRHKLSLLPSFSEGRRLNLNGKQGLI